MIRLVVHSYFGFSFCSSTPPHPYIPERYVVLAKGPLSQTRLSGAADTEYSRKIPNIFSRYHIP